MHPEGGGSGEKEKRGREGERHLPGGSGTRYHADSEERPSKLLGAVAHEQWREEEEGHAEADKRCRCGGDGC